MTLSAREALDRSAECAALLRDALQTHAGIVLTDDVLASVATEAMRPLWEAPVMASLEVQMEG